jgi:O-antigen ligase
MWRDGYRLWTASPRNFIFGIGMDSTKTHWREWGMFDGGKLPIGHFHSSPVQFEVERGLPALIIWLILLMVYGRTLWPGIRKGVKDADFDWRSLGILLGCFGGMIGFFTGGLVHNNIGDAEVAMLFYLLMGFGIKAARFSDSKAALRSSPLAD